MVEASFIIAVVACLAGILAAWYAFYPYRSQRHHVARARFVQQRKRLGTQRPELTRAALAYHSSEHDDGLPGMLAGPSWVPPHPIPLRDVQVRLSEHAIHDPPVAALRESAREMLPRKESLRRYTGYSEALGELARPSLFEDLPCYRLLSANLCGQTPTITVGLTTFFAGIDESEALAHEFSALSEAGAAPKARGRTLPVRSLVANPCRVGDRTTLMSVSALTLRVGEGKAQFYLHSRDSSAVAIAGNLLHLAPSGVFQPTADDHFTVQRDCSPWLTLCREYAEEYLGLEEARGPAGAALSYEEDEPYSSLMRAYEDARLQIFACGLGLDPLTLCGELVTIARVEESTFDEVFADLVVHNTEGTLRGRRVVKGRIEGFPFTEDSVREFLASDRLSPAARAALTVAWKCRTSLNLPGT